MRHRRITFVTLLMVFIALAAWWVLYLPYQPQRLYCLVPERTRFLSEHRELNAHWDDWCESGILQRIGTAHGLDAATLSALQGPVAGEFVKRFCARHTIAGFIPGPRGGTRFLATWIGSYGQWVRWGVVRPWPREWEAVKVGRRTAWIGRGWGTTQAAHAAVTVIDGVLIACLSADRNAIVELMARAELRRTDATLLLSGSLPEASGDSEDWPHHASGVWWESYDGGVLPRQITLRMRVEDRRRLAGRARIAPSLLPVCDDTLPLDVCEPIAALLAAAPAGVAALPASGWRAILGRMLDLDKTGIAAALSAARPDAPCLLALLRAEWPGRLRGFPVPTLVAAIPLRDGIDAAKQIAKELDRLNALQGLGLIPRRQEVGGWELTVIDSTQPGFLSRMDPRYRPAFAVADGWLLFGSNADSLGRLVSGADAGGNARWLTRLGARPHAGALWLNSRLAASPILNALAVATLGVTAESHEALAAGNVLRKAIGVAGNAGELGELCVWVRPGTSGNEFVFELDPLQ